MDDRPSADDASKATQKAVVVVCVSLLLVAATTAVEIKFATWPAGWAGALAILGGGFAVALLPQRLWDRFWAFFIWLILVSPIWFLISANLTCAWRQLCM